MNGLRVPVAIATAAWLIFPAVAHAQDQLDSAPPPHVAVVDGTVVLDRDGQAQSATPSTPFVPGDRLRTENGRAEILYPDGSTLDVDEFSSVELLDFALVRVTGGRVLLTVARANAAELLARVQIETPSASVEIDGPGEYRIAILNGVAGPQTELAVLRGSGTLTTDLGSQPLRSGERSVAAMNSAPSHSQPFNPAHPDAFTLWAFAQRDLRVGSPASAQYLPPDLQMYGGTLDRNGSWAYEAPYGYVWYPSVPLGWRPYYNGYWEPLPRFGWTWIGGNAWAWPTHHYGRWGYMHSRWFWAPDRQWAPAWVYWGAAPGYVGWCPLGFDNRPVFSLSASFSSHWMDGWVVLPRPYFGVRAGYVQHHAISPRLLPVNTPFVEHASPPIVPSRVVPRGVAGVAPAARGYAVPRTSAGVSDSRALPAAPSRSTFERRYGIASPQPAAQTDRFKTPLREDGASNRRPPAAGGGAFRSAQERPTVMPAPSQGDAIRRQPSFGAAPPAADAPSSAVTPGPIPRYPPRVERTAPSAPAAPAQEFRGRAVPRSSPPPASPAPSSGQAAAPAPGQAQSRGGDAGNSGGSAQRSHDSGSRRPR